MSQNKSFYFIMFQKTQMTIIKESPMRDPSLHRNHSYNIFGVTLTTNQTEMMTNQMTITTDQVVEVHHETFTKIKIISHTTVIVLRSRDQNHYDRSTNPQYYIRSR